MKVSTTFRHMDADDEIRKYVEEKVAKLAEKYFRRPQEATVILEAEKFRRIADITMRGETAVFTGKEEKEDLRSAIDLALDKLEKQARRQRDRLSKKKRGPDGYELAFTVYREAEAGETDEEREPKVIVEDKFVPKPMSVEDAVLLIEESRDDFIVFRNSDTMGICVLYRRQDGNFGLIEPGT